MAEMDKTRAMAARVVAGLGAAGKNTTYPEISTKDLMDSLSLVKSWVNRVEVSLAFTLPSPSPMGLVVDLMAILNSESLPVPAPALDSLIDLEKAILLEQAQADRTNKLLESILQLLQDIAAGGYVISTTG
jgi:hypothetical protein